jgi:hypothetical protein
VQRILSMDLFYSVGCVFKIRGVNAFIPLPQSLAKLSSQPPSVVAWLL